jgi:Zn-finger domain-containing protein
MAGYKIYYITKGPIRGSCDHQHRNIYYAYHCLTHDFLAAQKEGLLSDRHVYAVEDGRERELYEHEINELDHVRRVILKETTLKDEIKKINSES